MKQVKYYEPNELYQKLMSGDTSDIVPLTRLESYLLTIVQAGEGGSIGGSTGGGVEADGPTPGLYDANDSLTTSLDNLLANGTIHVEDGVVYTNYNTSTWSNDSADDIVGYLVLPNDGSITTIGDYAFYGCSGLKEIEIPESVTRIGSNAFGECAEMDSVVFAEGSTLDAIGEYAFGWCSALSSIAIPDSVTKIGTGAFIMCESLYSIIIPEGVTTIGDNVFGSCTGLEEVYFNAIAAEIDSGGYNPCVFRGAGEDGDGVHVVIGANVTRIPDYLFSSNSTSSHKIVSVEFEEVSVCEVIGSSAFYRCNNLTSIEIPDSVNNIGSNAFADCPSLKSAVLSDNITTISSDMFARCGSLLSITIPSSVTTIKGFAFGNCTNLATIYFEGSAEQWSAVSKDSYWRNNVPATEVVCSDGTVSLT